MNKIEKIKELIANGQHADALMNYCIGEFPSEEYTQEEREQVALWKIECLIATIPLATLGDPSNRIQDERIPEVEYSARHKEEMGILASFLAGLKECIDRESSENGKIAKYHQFREYVFNVIFERFKQTVHAYGNIITDASSWDTWKNACFGFNQLNVFLSKWLYLIGRTIPCDQSDYKSVYDFYDVTKEQIGSIWSCTERLNEQYTDISNGDVVLEKNGHRAIELLVVADEVEKRVITLFKNYTGRYLERHTNEECIILKKKMRAAFLLTRLNAVLLTQGGYKIALFKGADHREDFSQQLRELEGDIRQVEPSYSICDKVSNPPLSPQKASGGCYIATAVYGSYDCPEVWTLRRYRDDILAVNWYGRAFIKCYYAVSPTLVKWFAHTEWFQRLWKGQLDRLVERLQTRGIDSAPYNDK